MFAEKGYDETTVDEVAAAAGVSRRTLFNYFKSKEGLALSGPAEQGERIAERFAASPADEDIWESLRAAFRVLEEIESTTERRLEARAIAAAAITSLQAATEKWSRLGGRVDLFELYDAAVQAVRRAH